MKIPPDDDIFDMRDWSLVSRAEKWIGGVI